MDRREFLRRLACAPAIVRASSIMPLWVPPKRIWTPFEMPDFLPPQVFREYMASRPDAVKARLDEMSVKLAAALGFEAAPFDLPKEDASPRVILPPGALAIDYDEKRGEDNVVILAHARMKRPFKI